MWWMRLWGLCQPCLPQPGGGEPKRPAWEHSRCAGGGWRGLDICRPNVIKYEFSHCAGLSFLRIYEFQEKWPDTLRQTHCLCNMMWMFLTSRLCTPQLLCPRRSCQCRESFFPASIFSLAAPIFHSWASALSIPLRPWPWGHWCRGDVVWPIWQTWGQGAR